MQLPLLQSNSIFKEGNIDGNEMQRKNQDHTDFRELNKGIQKDISKPKVHDTCTKRIKKLLLVFA